MRAVAPVRVVALMAAAIALIANAGIPTADASTAYGTTTPLAQLDGRLLVAHGDNFMGGAMVMQTELQTASGAVSLELPASEHSRALELAGQRVRVLGSRVTSSFAAASLSPAVVETAATARAAKPAATMRTMRIAVVLMRLPGSTAEPVTKSSVQSSTFGATNSVANWYAQMSGKQVAVTGTVYGYYTGVRSCDLSTQTRVAEAAAEKNGYVATNFDHLVVYAPPQACGFAGMGWVGANGVFLNGTVNRGVMEHELGHNLGLWHAGAYACGVAPLSGSCLVDYGDPTDVMGATQPNHGYSAEHKFELGWMPSSEVRTVATGTQTIALTAAENPLVSGSIELIHVRATDGTLYAVDRRTSTGYDTGLSGVWIREVASVDTDDAELVRTTAFAPGQTFTSSVHHVTIKTLADSGPTASVRVCVGSCN